MAAHGAPAGLRTPLLHGAPAQRVQEIRLRLSEPCQKRGHAECGAALRTSGHERAIDETLVFAAGGDVDASQWSTWTGGFNRRPRSVRIRSRVELRRRQPYPHEAG